jgi:RNA polymerase sigma factor (sigma-70 family)
MNADDFYERLLKPIEKQMIRTVARIVRDPDDVADVFQEVLVTIWHKLERIDCHPNPQAYIIRICVTRAYDALRKKSRRRQYEVRFSRFMELFLPARFGSPLQDSDQSAVVHGAIAMLPPRQGQAVLLRAIEGSSYHAIADTLGCSEATARSHFSKGKARLATILMELGISMKKGDA